MLTREQINSKMQGFECPKYLYESCWKPIHEQCILAIDLAADNARLNEQLASLTEANDELRDHITAIEFERACLMSEIDKLKGR